MNNWEKRRQTPQLNPAAAVSAALAHKATWWEIDHFNWSLFLSLPRPKILPSFPLHWTPFRKSGNLWIKCGGRERSGPEAFGCLAIVVHIKALDQILSRQLLF